MTSKEPTDPADALSALREMVKWFGSYPEMIPNPNREMEWRSAIAAARQVIDKADNPDIEEQVRRELAR